MQNSALNVLIILLLKLHTIWATAWQQNHVHPAKTQISLRICAVWSEYLQCVHWVAKDVRLLSADSENCSDWADAQVELSLRWAHIILSVFSWHGSFWHIYCRQNGNVHFPVYLKTHYHSFIQCSFSVVHLVCMTEIRIRETVHRQK